MQVKQSKQCVCGQVPDRKGTGRPEEQNRAESDSAGVGGRDTPHQWSRSSVRADPPPLSIPASTESRAMDTDLCGLSLAVLFALLFRCVGHGLCQLIHVLLCGCAHEVQHRGLPAVSEPRNVRWDELFFRPLCSVG